MLISSGLILVGLMLLIAGGEWLVSGASRLAARMKISSVVIGLTVVAFGTSAPELGVSLQAVHGNAADVAIGNIVGSNILNVLLILGVSAMVSPLQVSNSLIRLDLPILLVASIASYLFARDFSLSRIEASCLLTG